MFKNKKGLGPVVASALLILVAVVSVVGFQTWFGGFSSGVFSKTEVQSGNSVSGTGIDTVIGQSLYFKNAGISPINVTEVKVDGTTCTSISQLVNSSENLEFSLATCLKDDLTKKREVVVFTSNGIHSEYYLIAGAGGGNFTAILDTDDICGTGVKIFSLSSWASAEHVGIASATLGNSLCVADTAYTLNTVCEGDKSNRLFYLGNTTNSHIWIDNSTAYSEPYPGYYNWQEVCIGAVLGDAQVLHSSADQSGGGYTCVGSYSQDDVYGGILGNCNHNSSNRIWFKIN